jgi:ATP-dependent RNA helicase RhlE
MEITKSDYTETLDFSNDVNYDLKSLLREVDEFEKKKKGKKK